MRFSSSRQSNPYLISWPRLPVCTRIKRPFRNTLYRRARLSDYFSPYGGVPRRTVPPQTTSKRPPENHRRRRVDEIILSFVRSLLPPSSGARAAPFGCEFARKHTMKNAFSPARFKPINTTFKEMYIIISCNPYAWYRMLNSGNVVDGVVSAFGRYVNAFIHTRIIAILSAPNDSLPPEMSNGFFSITKTIFTTQYLFDVKRHKRRHTITRPRAGSVIR